MALSPVMVELRADIGQFTSRMGEAGAEIKKLSTEGSAHVAKFQALGKAAFLGIGAAAIAGSVIAIKAAANYQESLTQLVTGAGESEKSIKAVGDGMLHMAGQVGISAMDLSKGMYLIESSGQHGANALLVLKAAAEGAKVGAADMASVANGLTTALNDYRIPASQAALVTSKLVQTVALGKTHMADLAASLATVLPAASTAKIGLDQVLGAMSTMTALGTPAADAATYLRQTIAQLSNPTAKARHEMEALGLSSIDISKNLGARGLTGTFDVLTTAITSKMGPAGTVLIESLKKSASSTTAFQKILANLPPTQQTYIAALATMVGGTKSMQAALELTGSNVKTFAANVKAISRTTTEAGNHVKGMALVQKDFNFQMDKAREAVGSVVIAIGEKLIPIVTAALGWIAKHKAVVEALAITVGVIIVAAIGAFVVGLVAANAVLIVVTAAVVGIAASLVYAWTHFRTFRSIVEAVFAGTLAAVQVFASRFLGMVITLIKGMEPFAAASDLVFGTHFKKSLQGAVKSLETMRKDMDDTLSRTVNDAKVKAAALAVSITQPLADRLPQYEAIARRYHTSLDAVLTAAGVTARDKAAAMATAMTRAFAGGEPQFAAVAAQYARMPAAALAAQDASAFSAASALGGALGAGLLVGLAARKLEVQSAAAAVGAAAVSGLNAHIQARSPSRASTYLGQMLGEGLARGIESKYARVAAAADGMGKVALAANRFLGQQILKGVEGKLAALKPALATMRQDLAGLQKERDTYADSLSAGISGKVDVGASFADVLTARSRAAAGLDAAQQSAAQATQNLTDLQARLADKTSLTVTETQQLARAQEALNDAQATATTAQTTYTAAQAAAKDPIGALRDSLKDQLADTKAFGAQLKKLAAEGASKDLIAQIAGQGSASGGTLAAALLSQGPSAVKGISTLMAQINKAGETAAAAISATYYQHGIDSMQALINGMAAKEKALQKQVARIQALLTSLSAGAMAVYDFHHPDPVVARPHHTATHRSHHAPVHRTTSAASHTFNISTTATDPTAIAAEIAWQMKVGAA